MVPLALVPPPPVKGLLDAGHHYTVLQRSSQVMSKVEADLNFVCLCVRPISKPVALAPIQSEEKGSVRLPQQTWLTGSATAPTWNPEWHFSKAPRTHQFTNVAHWITILGMNVAPTWGTRPVLTCLLGTENLPIYRCGTLDQNHRCKFETHFVLAHIVC